MVNEIRNLALDLADLENQMKTQSSSKSPWKQVRCQCKEEIDKEVVSLMEAECSCMICEEIFVDVSVQKTIKNSLIWKISKKLFAYSLILY